MGIVARAREKFFRATRLRRSIVELCQGKESSIDFFAGTLYTDNFIPIISLLTSESCLHVSNLQKSTKSLQRSLVLPQSGLIIQL